MSTPDPKAPASTGPFDSEVLQKARNASLKNREELDNRLSAEVGKYASEDTSLVVFGSLARGEWTSKSDLDWTYLIDGEANSDHLKISQQIQRFFRNEGYEEPGPTGTLGNMALATTSSTKSAASMTRTRTRPSGFCFFSNHVQSAGEQKRTNALSVA
jgi:predicted nucleotidyltransferase